MTKRRYSEEAPAPSPRGGGSGAFALAFALMFGVSFALTADSDSDPRSTYAQVAAQVTKSIETLQNFVMARRPASIRTGDSPSRPSVIQAKAISAAPAIAVVIDDLGINVARTSEAIALPANVTLSFLPYPSRSLELSRRAHLAGHEVLVHLPMQPSGKQNPGERALSTGLQSADLKQSFEWALSRVSDYDGINNHMGSQFTASRADLTPVMRELKSRRLFFLDSRTTASSQVETVAAEQGVLSGRRDVFIDAERSAVAIERQLSRIEDFARKNGNVIAIGHPYPETLKALSQWSKTIQERGYRLAPVREVLEMREGRTPALLTAGFTFAPTR